MRLHRLGEARVAGGHALITPIELSFSINESGETRWRLAGDAYTWWHRWRAASEEEPLRGETARSATSAA
jgi:hypothetical protein